MSPIALLKNFLMHPDFSAPIQEGAAVIGIAIAGTFHSNPFVQIIAFRCLIQSTSDALHYASLLSHEPHLYSTHPSTISLNIQTKEPLLKAVFYSLAIAPIHAMCAFLPAAGARIPIPHFTLPKLSTKQTALLFFVIAILQLIYSWAKGAYERYRSQKGKDHRYVRSHWEICARQEDIYQNLQSINNVAAGVIMISARTVLYIAQQNKKM